MRVDVTVDKSGKHPFFLVKCHGKEGQIWETKRRFAAFRDFRENIVAAQPYLIAAEFPPTIASRAYGIQLSEKQLSERRSLLREWLQEVVDKYDQLANDDFRISLFRLLRGESASFQLTIEDKALSHESFSRSARTEPTSASSATLKLPPTQQGKALKTMLPRRGSSSLQNDSPRDSAPVLTSPAVDASVSGSSMTVRISRGTVDNGHQTYETVINVGGGFRPYVVTKFFKDYRQLALDLKQEGVPVGHVDREDDGSSCSRGAGPHALPPFPPTYKRSMVGIALDEEHTSMRCRGLDVWMRALLCQYNALLLPSVQELVDRFLSLRADPDKSIHRIILNGLINGDVVGSSTTAVPTVFTPPPVPQLEGNTLDTAGGDLKEGMTQSTNSDNKLVRRGSLLDKLLPRKNVAEGADDGVPAAGAGSEKKRGRKGSKEREMYEAAEAQRAALGAKRKEEERIKEMHTLGVAVVRCSDIGGHPSYEVHITYQKGNAPHVISRKFFKDFRQLALDISNEGIAIMSVDAAGVSINMGSDHSSDTPNTVMLQQQGGGVNSSGEEALPPFPRTYKRSSIGISLPKADLQARCKGLDQWMRALLRNYAIYSPPVQGFINSFIAIDSVDAGRFRDIILHSLTMKYVEQTAPTHDISPSFPVTISDASAESLLNVTPDTGMCGRPHDPAGTSRKGRHDTQLMPSPAIRKNIGPPAAPVPSVHSNVGDGSADDNSTAGRARMDMTSTQSITNSSACVPGCVMS